MVITTRIDEWYIWLYSLQFFPFPMSLWYALSNSRHLRQCRIRLIASVKTNSRQHSRYSAGRNAVHTIIRWRRSGCIILPLFSSHIIFRKQIIHDRKQQDRMVIRCTRYQKWIQRKTNPTYMTHKSIVASLIESHHENMMIITNTFVVSAAVLTSLLVFLWFPFEYKSTPQALPWQQRWRFLKSTSQLSLVYQTLVWSLRDG